MRFKEFFDNDNGNFEDIKNTLSNIPQQHAELVKGYKWKFHKGNTLDGDSEHVGYIDDRQREIAVAAPWHYGREFTILHEVAHKVWERLQGDEKRRWIEISKKIPKDDDSLDQNAEELFCMFYANHYIKNKIEKFNHPEAVKFVGLIK